MVFPWGGSFIDCLFYSQIADLQQEHQREMEGLLENVRQLSRELKLQMLIIDNFIPPEYQVVFQHSNLNLYVTVNYFMLFFAVIYELQCEKIKNVVSDQVRHKLACTATDAC